MATYYNLMTTGNIYKYIIGVYNQIIFMNIYSHIKLIMAQNHQ